jgi:hypothetical protein
MRHHSTSVAPNQLPQLAPSVQGGQDGVSDPCMLRLWRLVTILLVSLSMGMIDASLDARSPNRWSRAGL